ncbi:MAG: TonB-dependent receptor [Bacteroidales bacterium]|jgi:TonB-linked SusC/RagA family outer membrane protein|nr:TonB-dependent receptor [Bacteroidales bacterium]
MSRLIRNQKLKFLLLILLTTITSLTGAQVAAQQARKVTGTVIDAVTREPMAGVTVSVSGTTTGVITDFDGKYTIEVANANSTLTFSYVGYASQSIVVGNNTTLDVQMALDITGLEEVIVTGYSTTVRKNVTSAIASANVASLQKKAVTDVAQALQGNVAGLNVIATNGNPGSAMNINIRGISAYTGDGNPLVLVDGVQVEGGLKNINSNDIKTVQVLKDAASAAIYGSRAANGVILVTTKKGESSSKASVNYQNYFGTQLPYKGISVCNSKEYITVLQRMYGNDLSGATLPPQAALDYIADPSTFKDYDWQKMIYSSAPMQSHDLSVSGGGNSGTYRLSTGYVNQKGIAYNTGYERVNIRANSDFNVSDHIKIGQSIAYTGSSLQPESYAWSRSLLSQAIKMYPYFSPKLDDGAWRTSSFYYGGGDNSENLIRNPFHFVSIRRTENTQRELAMNMYAQVDIFKGLSYKINGAYSNIDDHQSEYDGIRRVEYGRRDKALTVIESRRYNWNIDNLLRYQNAFGKNYVDVTLGFTSQKFVARRLTGYKRDFISTITSTLDGPGGANATTGGNIQENALLSFIGQAFYSYNDRYLLTVNFRRDGSSRFAPAYRWGNFPGVSLGWRLSNENIWKNSGLAKVINDLKIRAGYGELGRQNVGNYDYSPNLIYQAAVFGTSIQPGLIIGTPINGAISWEKMISKTLGLDYESYGGKVSGSFDLYSNKSSEMILGVVIPPSVGGGSINRNVGEIDNKGFEMAIDYKNSIGELSYIVGFNLGTTKTTIVNIGTDIAIPPGDNGEAEYDTEWITELHKGYGFSQFWLIKTEGLFRSQSEIDNYKSSDGTVIQPNAKPGDIKFVDFNDDGEISSDGDRQYCGSGVPKVNLGLNISVTYRDFDLFVGSTGAFGHVIYNANQRLSEKPYGYDNFSTNLLNAFDASTNPNSDFPRNNPYDPEENFNSRSSSDRYLEKGDYIKIRNMELGYTLPANIKDRLRMSSARIFVRAQNLVTFTSYTGTDPELGASPWISSKRSYSPLLYEAGIDRDSNPQARSFQIGVNVTF